MGNPCEPTKSVPPTRAQPDCLDSKNVPRLTQGTRNLLHHCLLRDTSKSLASFIKNLNETTEGRCQRHSSTRGAKERNRMSTSFSASTLESQTAHTGGHVILPLWHAHLCRSSGAVRPQHWWHSGLSTL